MSAEVAGELEAIRADPRLWMQGFGRILDEETREPRRCHANVLQRRIFAQYSRCLAAQVPCRMVVLKYRRAGSSTASTATFYHHAQNHRHRLGVIGSDYRSSSNLLEMVSTFGNFDDFPGWAGGEFTERMEAVPWEERLQKKIATKLQWPDGPKGEPGARIELYTAQNPESARSAGLQGFLATEVGRWPKDGVMEGGRTLVAMINTLPRRGFHLCVQESTAGGAEGCFYETCKTARWPEEEDYWRQWESDWPLTREPIGSELQFVFIFAAFFEDDRNFIRLSPEEAAHIEATLDKDPEHEGERDLIARYGQEGPRGMRLGSEVDATVFEQLGWRRAIIRANGGLANFLVEFPSSPLDAFRASGSPVFTQAGLTAIEVSQRNCPVTRRGETGVIDKQPAGALIWRRATERESVFTVWEQPKEGARYLIVVDPMSGCELVTGTNKRDRHSVLVLRDKYQDEKGTIYPVKLVARIRPPCLWDNAPLSRQITSLSRYYGGAPVVVENNIGVALIEKLVEANVNLYYQADFVAAEQREVTRIGWRTDEGSRRLAVEMAREYIREQKIEILCPHVLSEMKTFSFDTKGVARGQAGNHDDDVLALAIGLACLKAAIAYHDGTELKSGPADAGRWKAG